MEFDQLRTLIAVLDHGSFTRAAEALGISQSTVSFHIKALEQDVATKLIDRGREGVHPTSHGKLLRRYADALLALRTEAEATLLAHDRGAVGRVVVAASTIPGEYLLPPALARLRSSHPEVSVVVQVSDSARAIAALNTDECDLALVGTVPQDRRLEVRAFAQDEIVLVGPVPNPYALKASDDLTGVPLVLRQEGSGTRDAVAAIVAAGLGGGKRGATVEVGSSEAAKRCIAAGVGLGFVSKIAIADELERGLLQVISLDGTPVQRRFFIATRRGATLSPAATALLEVLCEAPAT